MKTHTQLQRAASAKIKAYVNAVNVMNSGINLCYTFRRGLFIIDNIGNLLSDNAKSICEKATGMKFLHISDSVCKLCKED